LEVSNIVQIISASIAAAASIVPIYFVVNVRAGRQRILSVILFGALFTYSAHALLEASNFDVYQLFARVCFVISAFGIIAAYFFYQMRSNHMLIGGAFGAVMIASFGAWMAAEFTESIINLGDTQRGYIEMAGSVAMASFAVFVLARFLWLRSITPISARQLSR
jgi:hypothetical protein